MPGIGPTSVDRIIRARRYGNINFEMLRKMRVVLKRAQYFITCNGKMLGNTSLDQKFILTRLTEADRKDVFRIEDSGNSYTQMNLFSDFNLASAGG